MDTEVDKRKGIIACGSIHRFYRFDINKTAKENADDAIVESVAEGSEKTIKEKIDDLVAQIRDRNGTPPHGYKGNKKFQNSDGILPNGNYREYDLYPNNSNGNRGLERIVIGDDGSVWYTPDHYETFIKIE